MTTCILKDTGMRIKGDNGRHSGFNPLLCSSQLFNQQLKTSVQKIIKIVLENSGRKFNSSQFIPAGGNLQLYKKPFTQIMDSHTRWIKKMDFAQHSLQLTFADIKILKMQTVNNHLIPFGEIPVTIKITKNLNGNLHLAFPDILVQCQLLQENIMKTVILNRLKEALF